MKKKERDKMNNEYLHFAFMLYKSVKRGKRRLFTTPGSPMAKHKFSRHDTL